MVAFIVIIYSFLAKQFSGTWIFWCKWFSSRWLIQRSSKNRTYPFLIFSWSWWRSLVIFSILSLSKHSWIKSWVVSLFKVFLTWLRCWLLDCQIWIFLVAKNVWVLIRCSLYLRWQRFVLKQTIFLLRILSLLLWSIKYITFESIIESDIFLFIIEVIWMREYVSAIFF